ncbi:MAG: DUF167 domain-containing protein [Desulfomonile sp.]|nr:DUF167 domain-containing protein [Desulfomonile sp.]
MVLEDLPDGIALRVRVIPRARRTALAGVRGDSLVVKLTAPPVDGAANSALVEFLAEALGVPVSAVKIVSGANSRSKTLVISRIDVASAATRLGLPVVSQA